MNEAVCSVLNSVFSIVGAGGRERPSGGGAMGAKTADPV